MRESLFLALFLCVLVGCEGGQVGNTEKGALGGAAVGAGLGAIIGSATGDAGVGTAIGGGIGALSGALIGRAIDQDEARELETDNRLSENEKLLQENQRLIDELKRRGADVRVTDRGVVVNLPDVLFEFDQSRLTPGARDRVADIAQVVRDIQDRRISVEGHTDSVGSISYNQDLSERRARVVAASLVEEGISRRRIFTRGFGEGRPIATNQTDSGRARNRRVEVIVENY
ncbi:MAG: OmpA family protein [Bdellovibrionales bacterium]|nr:OmpA family protein [Bdellovibrionales bacterium]